MKKTATAVGISVVILLFGVFSYEHWMSPTRIAFVNYPEYVIAPLLDQEIPGSVEVIPLQWNEKSGKELKRFDMILFFGMGLNFTDRQQMLLRELDKPIFVTSSTRKETALNTLPEVQSVKLRQYLNNLNKENFRRMLNFIRVDVDGKKFRNPAVEPAKEVIRSGFFHISEENVFRSYSEYLNWYKANGHYRENTPTVCLLSGNGGGDLGKVIATLESKGLNVVGAHGMGEFLKLLQEVKPALVIYQPHGRLSYDAPEEAVQFLKQNNIPLFCPLKVNQPYEEFLRDQRGMTGGMLSQSVIMPELDGAAVPFVLSALFRNKRGLLEYRIIPDRLEKFSELVRKTVLLKQKPNREKKIAIVYYKEPGKNAMVAGGLEVGHSLFNTLKYLQSSGFHTGDLPATPEELNQKIQEEAPVFGSYAPGAMEEFLKHAHPIKISGNEFARWMKRAMPDDLAAEVVQKHGNFPEVLELGALRFGNILLMPQGAAGSGDENTVVHGVKQIPPYRYLATYFYCRFGFEADALLHFGTHGSMEFTPYKQVALSSYDWPDVLIGEMPHYYLYVINNIGEALIAKRRSYATMISHLTAPFMNADSYGTLARLDEKMHHYEIADNAMLKGEYAKSCIQLVKELKIDKDMKLSGAFAKGQLTEEDFRRIHAHIHEIGSSKVTRGLYVIGRPYSEGEADETARLMMVDSVAAKLFEEDVKSGKAAPEKKEDMVWFDRNYITAAKKRIEQAFRNPATPSVPAVAASPAGHRTGATDVQMKDMVLTGKLPDGRDVPPAMMEAMRGAKVSRRVKPEKVLPPPEYLAVQAKQDLLRSTTLELAAMANVFSGGYLAPSPGGDPVGNPDTVPTGRNLYGLDPERTPTRESYHVGCRLGEALIAEKRKTTGEYPKKVAFTLWGGEFIRTQGTNIGEIFFLLGVEPVWDSRGRVTDVRLIPSEKLQRPRIDVVVQTSGQFRGAATSRMRLIDKAVRLAAEDSSGTYGNHVREGSLSIARELVANGMSAEEAKSFADTRIFGGVNGNFGTNVTGLIQSGGRWDDSKVIADLYMNNMGALYTDSHWGEHVGGVFRAALSNTDTVLQSRSSNSWGPLSLDHVYEFTGGISLAAKAVTGKNPEAFFNDLRTPGRARIQEAGEAAMVEARSTLLNPKYLKEMLEEGPTAAGRFAEAFRNTYGWEVTRPGMIDNHLWEDYKNVYIDDSLKLGIPEFFEKKNPYALQEMTGVMLETIRKGYWKASPETVRQLSERHAELVENFGAGCSGYVCNNEKLRDMIARNLATPQKQAAYRGAIQKIRTVSASSKEKVTGQTLKEKTVAVPSKSIGKKSAVWIICVVIAFGMGAILLGGRRKKRSSLKNKDL